MRDALAKDSLIHRALSVSNIILVTEPGSTIRKGYLIDWESSCKVDEDTHEAVQPGRAVSLYRCSTGAVGGLIACSGYLAVRVNSYARL